MYVKACTKDIKQLAYFSLVRPSLEYCSVVWDPYTQELSSKLEAVQRRAARFVLNNYEQLSSVTSMLQELDWQTLTIRRKITRLAVFQKACQGDLAILVKTLLHPVKRPTRHSHTKSFITISTSSDIYKYAYLPRTVTEWNQLPQSLIDITDNKAFKEQLKQHFK